MSAVGKRIKGMPKRAPMDIDLNLPQAQIWKGK